jgi:alpha-mannosidase
MDENADFVFTHTSVLFLQWVEESDPELFARIRERVAEGRWQVVGGWWIEPDCNIPAGESFVRQGLYGQRWLLDRFGITATTGANLDSFGHNASLPQILRRSGLDSYVFLRPKPDENAEVPGPLFHWESADGSSVLAYRIPHEYCAPRDDLGDHVAKSLATLPDESDELAVFYGVGNHGGGPTRANLRSIAELDRSGDGTRLELSSLRRFFDAVAGEDAPVWRGDLQYHAPGCYTTHSGVKRWNRRAETLLQRAEKWSVVADALGVQPYPLRDRIAEGRLQVIGGWWIEPDCNIPGGESFVRQALYGQRYLHDRFGIVATTGANLDSFGHNATIPQILAKSGCDSYVFLRPGPTEKELPGPIFHWESPDGSRVLAYRIPHEYCAPKDDIGEHVEKAVASLPEGDEEWAVFYGVGNHGGGPTRANLDQIARLN